MIDELLMISTWSVIEIQSSVKSVNEFDLTMSIGGKFKLLENYSENLLSMKEITGHQSDIYDIS